MNKEEINAVFKGDIIGREVIFYDVTTSTNEKAMELAQKAPGRLEGTVIIADSQERGRGRFGRTWISPPGVNLYFTVLLKPSFSAKEASVVTLMAAIAVASAIRECVNLNAVIKWPNDILIGNKKVGGILTEMKSNIDTVDFIAVGIGVNVNMSLDALPENLRALATSLKGEKGEMINRVRLLGTILAKMEHWYKILLKGGKKALFDEWLRLNSTIGEKVMVKTHNHTLRGIAEGVGDNGELIVKLSSGKTEKILAGEVTILKRGFYKDAITY